MEQGADKRIFKFPVALSDKQREQIAGLEALDGLLYDCLGEDSRNYDECVRFADGEQYYLDYTAKFLMRLMCLVVWSPDSKRSFDGCVKSRRADYCRCLFEEGRKADVLNVFKTYPALVYPGEEGLLLNLEKEAALEQAAPDCRRLCG